MLSGSIHVLKGSYDATMVLLRLPNQTGNNNLFAVLNSVLAMPNMSWIGPYLASRVLKKSVYSKAYKLKILQKVPPEDLIKHFAV